MAFVAPGYDTAAQQSKNTRKPGEFAVYAHESHVHVNGTLGPWTGDDRDR
jgi:hypothetical protein